VRSSIARALTRASDAGGVGSVTDSSVTAACAQGADPLAIQR